MNLFVETDDFRQLNIGFALDEGSVIFTLLLKTCIVGC